ncbi:MAG TPA: glycosyltransferase family 2 protein [Candidatus Limnocylindrales bacterium]|nr:glycosyltransferase family 2 protein [Candidatus Limnocylindrales bacterium]
MTGAGTGSSSSVLPFVSVIIPMRNEEAWIARCLGSVLAQDYPADRMEVIVTDGMSTDSSPQMLADLAKRDPRVRVLANPGLIVPTGLNLAIAAARGDVIARIDAHTMIEPDYLRRGIELLARTGASNVGGPMICRGGSPVGDAIAAAMASRFGIGATFHFATGEVECDTVYMGMWPRRVFEEVGLFDEEFVRNQDDELSYRIRKAGGRIVVSPVMRSIYQNRESWKALASQFRQYGVWKVRVLQKHPRQMSIRHFVPPLFQAGVVVLVLGGIVVWRPALWIGLAAVALYAGLIGVVAVSGARGAAARARLWLALVLIHQSWAAGFLIGLVRFANRWGDTGGGAGRLPPACGGQKVFERQLDKA